jgi:hypothetical protein
MAGHSDSFRESIATPCHTPMHLSPDSTAIIFDFQKRLISSWNEIIWRSEITIHKEMSRVRMKPPFRNMAVNRIPMMP